MDIGRRRRIVHRAEARQALPSDAVVMEPGSGKLAVAMIQGAPPIPLYFELSMVSRYPKPTPGAAPRD